MGTRIKVFESTGLAPNGRLYAGDLNALQDHFADQSNLSQQIDVATLTIGETALKLLRYGPGEARITGALRIDGIFRGLGGLYAGAFTTAQRDAIAAGLRPYGLIILNTQTNRPEWNSGTDAVPIWIPFSDTTAGVPIGSTIDWPWVHTQLPSNYLLAYGQAVPRASYPVLNALASASGYPHGNGDGSTTFNLPDFRGRASFGKDDMGGTAAGRVTAGGSGIPATTLGASGGSQSISLATGELPSHSHSVTGAPGRSGSISLSGSVALTGNVANGTLALPNHGHSISDPQHNHSYNDMAGGGSTGSGPGAGGPVLVNGYPYNTTSSPTGITVGNPTSLPAITGSITNGTLQATNGTLAISDTMTPTVGTLGTATAGSGTAHNNMPPAIIVNVAMRVA